MCRLRRMPFGSDLARPAKTHTPGRKKRGSDVGDADRCYRSWSINRSPNSVKAQTAITIMAPA
jgi:hypothetical protein